MGGKTETDLEKPKGTPVTPKKPPKKKGVGHRTAPDPPEGSTPAPTAEQLEEIRRVKELNADLYPDPAATIADLKKQLKSQRGRANAHERYRATEKEEHLQTLRELNQAQKDRDDAKDRVKELEKVPETKTVSFIKIEGQEHYRNKREHARNLVKKLVDDGVWYFSVGERER